MNTVSSQPPGMWCIENLEPDVAVNADALSHGLRLHIAQPGGALLTTVVQIAGEQRAYLSLRRCAQCHLDRCTPGCRVDLLRRVLRASVPHARLRYVPDGLIQRPYTRWYRAWPTGMAQVIDAEMLQHWPRDARLTLHWQQRRWPRAALCVGAVLGVGTDGPDARPILSALGWRAVDVSRAARLYVGQPRWQRWPYPAEWRQRPGLLFPKQHLPRPDRTQAAPQPADTIVRHQHATWIAKTLEEAGARVEFLDLHGDGWTASVAATTAEGSDPRPLIEAATLPGTALELVDLATSTVTLDRSQPASVNVLPPVLSLGTRPNGHTRWLPISPRHHLIVSGPTLPGVICGLIAPLVDGRTDVRIGVLDLSDDGLIAQLLASVPYRVPTVQRDDVQELLASLASTNNLKTPGFVVLYAESTAACEAAVNALLRATAYLQFSIVVVMPDEQQLPASIKGRVPIIRIRDDQAEWTAPFGDWKWAQPTILRLPWRDPAQPWPKPLGISTPGALLLAEDFWSIPDHLHQVLLGDRVDVGVADNDIVGLEDALFGEEAPIADDAASGPIRFDHAERLVIDDALLAHVLRWAEEQDGGEGVSFKTLQSGLGLPNRVVTEQLMTALTERNFIAERLPRQGWFRLTTVHDAISSGRLEAACFIGARAGSSAEPDLDTVQLGEHDES